MEAASLLENIQEEIRQIIRIQHLIQSELDEINTLTKPEGFLDVAVREGTESTEKVAAVANVSLSEETLAKFKDIQAQMNMSLTEGDVYLPQITADQSD